MISVLFDPLGMGQVHRAIYMHMPSPFGQSEGETILAITVTLSGPVHGNLLSDRSILRMARTLDLDLISG